MIGLLSRFALRFVRVGVALKMFQAALAGWARWKFGDDPRFEFLLELFKGDPVTAWFLVGVVALGAAVLKTAREKWPEKFGWVPM